MELSDLTAYAREKYQLAEEFKWKDFPGFSVLSHPITDKWIALLMRQWNTETGEMIECCDIRCGSRFLAGRHPSWISTPLRMKGPDWVSVRFIPSADESMICHLLDEAILCGNPQGYTMVLEPDVPDTHVSHDTAIPFSDSTFHPRRQPIPDRIRRMRSMIARADHIITEKALTFYKQAKFMEDYEDDFPWEGDFDRYFPTYRDLSDLQLRGYFSWRTQVRRGNIQPVPLSLMYLYLYELLNGIGADSPVDTLRKLKYFSDTCSENSLGDWQMTRTIDTWILEYAVWRNIPPEEAEPFLPESILRKDNAYAVMKHPLHASDDEVYSAICLFCNRDFDNTPVMKANRNKGIHLFSQVWRCALQYPESPADKLYEICFGKQPFLPWYPLANAVIVRTAEPSERVWKLNAVREYRYEGGTWQRSSSEFIRHSPKQFRGFIRRTDARLRHYLNTGKYLKDNPDDAWADPYIEYALAEIRKDEVRLARDSIRIDFSGLDKIRSNASITRDSLLTEADLADEPECVQVQEPAVKNPETEPPADLPLNPFEISVLRRLLDGQPVRDMIQKAHQMPSIIADNVNEAMFDTIGDTILLCEDDELTLVEDYIDDLNRMLGGTANE